LPSVHKPVFKGSESFVQGFSGGFFKKRAGRFCHPIKDLGHFFQDLVNFSKSKGGGDQSCNLTIFDIQVGIKEFKRIRVDIFSPVILGINIVKFFSHPV